MSKLIEIKHLAKSFGSQQVLKDINMTVNGNENIAVLGKSGTGKSVLLKCIVGLLIADRGTINVFGHDVIQTTEKKLNQIRSRIGYLFQTGALYDSMSIRENLIFPLKRNLNYSVNDEEEMDELVDKNLEQVGLLDAKNKMPEELSGGMRKRAGLARTLMLSPEVILYDEPTTGLDPSTSMEISRLILNIQKESQASSIIVTHDMKCAEITSDNVKILHDGHFIAEGDFNSLKKIQDNNVQDFFVN